MDIIHLLDALFGFNANMSIDINLTLPMMFVVLFALHLCKKINEKRTKDDKAQSKNVTRRTANLQLNAEEEANRPQKRNKDKLYVNS